VAPNPRGARLVADHHLAKKGFFSLDWRTGKAIDHAHLSDTLGPVRLEAVETIVMDEFAIQKGHRYATVVAEPVT
jgi:transposase